MKISNTHKQYIYNRDAGKCYFCRKTLKLNKITLDHYLPKSKRGTMDIFNLVTCCRFCNKVKSNRIPNGYNEMILKLFQKAVKDNRIIGCNLGISQRELQKMLLEVDRIEGLTNHFIFQSNQNRFYVRDNMVYKIASISTFCI